MDAEDFNATEYWLERIDAEGDLTAVGHRSLGPDYNRHIYARREELLGRLASDLGLEPTNIHVLDLGCGHGFYVDFWKRCGVLRLTGVDVSGAAVARLRSRYPEFRFLDADVTAPFGDQLKEGRFQVITAFDLVYHILEDEGLSRMLRTVSSSLAEDGYFIWTDRVPRRDYSFTPHVRYRSWEHVSKMLDACGLEIVRSQPLFLTLEPPVIGWLPVDLPVAAIYRGTGTIMKRVPALGDGLGRLAASIDRSVMARISRTPNHYLLVARQRPKTRT